MLFRSEQLNPLGIAMQQQLRACLADLSRNQDVAVLVITGAGKAFCVGADLTSIDANQSNQTLGQHVGETMRTLSNRLIEDIRALPFPVVSAVNGPCAGAGVSLALAADIVIGARSAYFFLSFMPRLGIVPDLGSTWFLERFIGRPRALGLTLLGDRLSAEQAQAWGLIWNLTESSRVSASVAVTTWPRRSAMRAGGQSAARTGVRGELRRGLAVVLAVAALARWFWQPGTSKVAPSGEAIRTVAGGVVEDSTAFQPAGSERVTGLSGQAYHARAIETIRTGQRVLARNPQLAEERQIGRAHV